MGDNQAAALRILAWVGGFGESGVARIPRIEEGVAALLDPAIEVGGGDLVGEIQQRVGGIEQLDRRLLVDNALGQAAAHGERKRGREGVALILDDERAAVADEFFEAGLDPGEFGTDGVGADADDDDVVSAEISGDEIGAGEQMRRDAHAFHCFGDEIAGAHNVADAQTGRELDVDLAGLEFGGRVLVIGTQARVADTVPAGIVSAAAGLRDGLDGVGAGLSGGRRDGEKDRIGIARGLAMELRLCGIGVPAVGKFEGDGAVGRGLGVDSDTNWERTSVEGEDAGLRVDTDADGGGDDKGFVETAGSGDALKGLHNFADADREAVEGELRPCVKRIGREGALAPLRDWRCRSRAARYLDG